MEPTDTHDATPDANTTQTHIRLEVRPAKLMAALFDQMPFPNIGPVQDVSLDVGITAYRGTVTLSGLVFKGYADHQLLFEQRWPARIIQRRIGEDNLTIEPQTGIAVRSIQFLLHGYERLTMLEITAVAKTEEGQSTQAILQAPVVFHTQQTDLHFPLAGTWWAIQAGDWSDQHKMEVFSQAYALDLVKLGSDNSFFTGRGQALEDHYSWNQPVYATAGGKITYVCYDMPDQPPGTPPDERIYRDDMRRLLGNAVAISHANGEFSFYGHLQQASLQVNQGEIVRRGALIGRVGNSGRSPGPHLHFHLMDGPNLFIDQGLPFRLSHFSAGGQFFDKPSFVPTRMIVAGPHRSSAEHQNTGEEG